jgi:uncharacterized protein (DUF1778 family)
MSVRSTQGYVDLPADERFETRIPKLLKRHAESAALANGETLSQYVVQAIATRVAEDLARQVEWHLTVPEQVALLQVLASPAPMTPALSAAEERAKELFGIE